MKTGVSSTGFIGRMISLKHQNKVIALIVGGVVVYSLEAPEPFALVAIVLSITSFCVSTCASLIKRTPYEKSINGPRYNIKDKFELGGTISGYVFGGCALLTFTFNKETTMAWIIAVLLFFVVVTIATIINMRSQGQNRGGIK